MLSLPSPTARVFVEGGGEAAPVLLPSVVDKHLQKPHLVRSPTPYYSPRANRSSPVLVPGRKETKWSARVGAHSGSNFHIGVAVVWSQLATPGAPGPALGCGLCLQIPAKRGARLEAMYKAWASRRPGQAGLGGLCLAQAVECRRLACPLPRPRPRCRLCPQRRSCGCPRGFDC